MGQTNRVSSNSNELGRLTGAPLWWSRPTAFGHSHLKLVSPLASSSSRNGRAEGDQEAEQLHAAGPLILSQSSCPGATIMREVRAPPQPLRSAQVLRQIPLLGVTSPGPCVEPKLIGCLLKGPPFGLNGWKPLCTISRSITPAASPVPAERPADCKQSQSEPPPTPSGPASASR